MKAYPVTVDLEMYKVDFVVQSLEGIHIASRILLHLLLSVVVKSLKSLWQYYLNPSERWDQINSTSSLTNMAKPKTLPKELVAALPCLLGVLWQDFQPEDDILTQPSAVGASICNPILLTWLLTEFIGDCFCLGSDANNLSTSYQS